MGEEQARRVGTLDEPEQRDCTLGELIELINAECDVSSAMQALIVLAQAQQVALAVSGAAMVKLSQRAMPVGMN